MGWNVRNLSTQFQAPPALFGPAAYDFASQATEHVFYLGFQSAGKTTGVITELYWDSSDVWHVQNLMDKAGAPNSTTNPNAFVFTTEGTQHVLYLGESPNAGHVHELWWDGDWHHSDLAHDAGAPDANHPPNGFEFHYAGTQHLVYMGVDRHVHVLSRGSGDGSSWSHKDLTHDVGGPGCAVAPGGYAFDQAHQAFVNFRSDDGQLYEYVNDGRDWTFSGSIGQGLNAPRAIDGGQTGYVFQGEGTRHLDFQDGNYDIWEFSFDGSWSLKNLTGDLGAPKSGAGMSPAGYVFESTVDVPVATQHVIYTDGYGYIQELWRDPTGWHYSPLTSGTDARSMSTPAVFADQQFETQHVVYSTETNEMIELRWTRSAVGGSGRIGLGQQVGAAQQVGSQKLSTQQLGAEKTAPTEKIGAAQRT